MKLIPYCKITNLATVLYYKEPGEDQTAQAVLMSNGTGGFRFYEEYTTGQYTAPFEIDYGRKYFVLNTQTENGIDILDHAEYYPYGYKVLGRQAVSSLGYRFGYQGQFAEDETGDYSKGGYNSFEARLYDPRIGRWTTIDPAGQFFSPYLGMGNDPNTNIDKNGKKAYSIRLGKNAYEYYCTPRNDDLIYSFCGYIPFGSIWVNSVYRMFGYKPIDFDNALLNIILHLILLM